MENIIEKRIGTEKDDSCLGRYELRPVTTKDKIKHFKDYYLKVFLLIGILALAGGYILWITVYHYDVTAVSVMIIGNGETDSLADDLTEYLNLENSRQNVEVTESSENEIKTSTVFSARIASGDLNIIIGEKDLLTEYAQKGILEEITSLAGTSFAEKYRINLSEPAAAIVKSPDGYEYERKILEYMMRQK